MTYFYPFGIPQVGVSSSYAAQATTASAAFALNINAQTAFWAATVQASGSSGSAGPVASGCTTAPTGPTGPAGPVGPTGPSLISCPAGSKACPNITPPSGYILVCIEIPPGCSEENTYCPGTCSTGTGIPTATGTVCASGLSQDGPTVYLDAVSGRYFAAANCTFPVNGDYRLLSGDTATALISCSDGYCSFTSCTPTTTTTTTTTSPPGCSGTCGQSTYCTPPCVCSVDPEGIVMGVCQDPGDE